MNRLASLIYGRQPAGDSEWRELLSLADRNLCTPLLRDSSELPHWLEREVSLRISKNQARRTALIRTYEDAAQSLQSAGLSFILIKGFTHEADARIDPALRSQGDIDLLCTNDLPRAEEALLSRGFEFHPGAELSDNHRRPLLKPHRWQWQGDYFDPAQPVPIELHRTIWSPRRDRIPTTGVEDFQTRRTEMEVTGLRVPVFCDVDRLAIAALHLLRHILRNNVRLGHAWELQRMLDLRAADPDFWARWQQFHPAGLRSLESIAFRFACEWFGGALHEIPLRDWNALPPPVHEWFERYAFAPVENIRTPNKAALWLHLALLPNFFDRWSVARRRLIPLHLPRRAEANGSYLRHLARRGRYHALALARALGSGDRASTTR